MNPEELKILILAILVLTFLFDQLLDWLNVRRELTTVPPTISEHLSQQKLQEIKSYQKINYRFGLLTGTISFVLTLLFVGFGIFGELGEWLQAYISHPHMAFHCFFRVALPGCGFVDAAL